MLLEKQQRENNFKESNEPDFRPRYRRTLPAGMDIRQVIIQPESGSRISHLRVIIFWQRFAFWRRFPFLTNISIFDRIFDLDQNLYFWPKFRFSSKNFDFWPKFRFLSKISIFEQNFDFWAKFRFLTINLVFPTKFWFSTNISIFDQNLDFRATFGFFNHKSRFSNKILIFDQNFAFRRIFGRLHKIIFLFWCKIFIILELWLPFLSNYRF